MKSASSAESPKSCAPLRAWWRLAGTPAGLTMVFDGAVFVAMAVLGWKLLTPWRDALGAGESLMLIGLIVCAGLWASICAEDLERWRKLCRRWTRVVRSRERLVAETVRDAPDEWAEADDTVAADRSVAPLAPALPIAPLSPLVPIAPRADLPTAASIALPTALPTASATALPTAAPAIAATPFAAHSTRPRVRSAVWPTRRPSRATSRTLWHVVTRH